MLSYMHGLQETFQKAAGVVNFVRSTVNSTMKPAIQQDVSSTSLLHLKDLKVESYHLAESTLNQVGF